MYDSAGVVNFLSFLLLTFDSAGVAGKARNQFKVSSKFVVRSSKKTFGLRVNCELCNCEFLTAFVFLPAFGRWLRRSHRFIVTHHKKFGPRGVGLAPYIPP
jgi:hypothetical protein